MSSVEPKCDFSPHLPPEKRVKLRQGEGKSREIKEGYWWWRAVKDGDAVMAVVMVTGSYSIVGCCGVKVVVT